MVGSRLMYRILFMFSSVLRQAGLVVGESKPDGQRAIKF
jgi:hypothetical protein